MAGGVAGGNGWAGGRGGEPGGSGNEGGIGGNAGGCSGCGVRGGGGGDTHWPMPTLAHVERQTSAKVAFGPIPTSSQMNLSEEP